MLNNRFMAIMIVPVPPTAPLPVAVGVILTSAVVIFVFFIRTRVPFPSQMSNLVRTSVPVWDRTLTRVEVVSPDFTWGRTYFR